MEVDEEDLPAVNLNSPRKDRFLGGFKMPDASVLVAQRRLEDEQNSTVLRMLSNDQDDCNDMFNSPNSSEILQSTSNSSNFYMPDADLIAANRKLEIEKDILIQDLLKEQETIDKDEITMCLEVLHIEKSSTGIPAENPGINMSELDIDKILDTPSRTRCVFMKNVITMVEKSENEENLTIILDHLFVSTMHMYADKKISLKLEDILCHALLTCAIILDIKCRLVFTSITTNEVLYRIIEKVPPNLQTKETLDRFSNQILANFKHYHDRLHLAESMVLKCNPADIDTDSKYFSIRLARQILQTTLCELIGCPVENNSSICRSFSDMKRIFSKEKRVDGLSSYEQYIMLKLANEMQWMFYTTAQEKSKEKKASKWIISFFNSLKSNGSSSKNADFFKVKALCSRINLLWQMDSEEFET